MLYLLLVSLFIIATIIFVIISLCFAEYNPKNILTIGREISNDLLHTNETTMSNCKKKVLHQLTCKRERGKGSSTALRTKTMLRVVQLTM